MGRRSYLRSFAGGELSQEMWGRIGDVKFQTGLARAWNMVTLPHGPVRSRPGFRYVATTKNSGSEQCRLIEFQFSETETLMVEMGPGYFRFYDEGVVVPYSSPADTYVVNAVVPMSAAGVDVNNSIFITANPHGLATDDRICITAGLVGTVAPGGTQLWEPTNPIYYYAILVDDDEIQLSDTLGGSAINITDVGTGGFVWLHRAYELGDLVAQSGDDYTCKKAPPIALDGSSYQSVVPGSEGSPTTYWHQLTPGLYEVPNGYAEADLFGVNHKQSNDIITFTHRGYPTAELRRRGTTQWSFVEVEYQPQIGAPSNVTSSPNVGDNWRAREFVFGNPTFRIRVGGGSGLSAKWTVPDGSHIIIDEINHTPGIGDTPLETGEYIATNSSGAEFDIVSVSGHSRIIVGYADPTDLVSCRIREVEPYSESVEAYVVTAVDAEGNESQVSDIVTEETNNLFVIGAYNHISWDAVVGANHYQVYRQRNGLYGLIGQVEDEGSARRGFTDRDHDIDLANQPPKIDESLSGTDYPQGVTHHEGRRCFGGTQLFPQQIWMTRSGTESDLSSSIPVRDADRLSFAIAAHEADWIQHLVSLGDLLALTNSSEYAVRSTEDSVITPTSIEAKWQSGRGASLVDPIVVDNQVVFAANRGGRILSVGYDLRARGFVPSDLSLRATHLFEALTIADSAISKAPHQILWFVSSNGGLLGLTFIPRQDVMGWHQHYTGTTFDDLDTIESVAAVTEGDEDVVYVVVRRTINGSPVRYIERMASWNETTLADMVLVDSAVTLTSPGTGTIGGFSHLATETVSITADGIVLPQQDVSAGGEITLTTAYTTVTVGLPIDAVMRTLPMAAQIEGFGQGRKKAADSVWVRVADSGSFEVGQALDDMKPSNSQAHAVQGTLTAETLADETVQVTPGLGWSDDGQVWIRQRQPLPLRVVAMTVEEAYGG